MSEQKDIEKSKPKTSEDDEEEMGESSRSNSSTQARSQHHPPAQSIFVRVEGTSNQNSNQPGRQVHGGSDRKVD